MNTTDIHPLLPTASLMDYRKQADALLHAAEAGQIKMMQWLSENLPLFSRLKEYKYEPATFTLENSQFIVARSYGFTSWETFEKFIAAFGDQHSLVANFEVAADAVVDGNIQLLGDLLNKHPELVHERSLRLHKATLLHYTGANGVEDYRQRTTANAIAIANLLLEAGAEVDAPHCPDNKYGTGTVLGLVATSIHPKLAGVQIELLQTLIDAGASPNGLTGGWNPLLASLQNGRGEAAMFLAMKGAHMNLESAAGVGRVDIVKSYFNSDNTLKANATKSQMENGFKWACEYGHKNVVEYLLDKGINIRTGENSDMTGLHWAIVGCQPDIVKLLLKRGAPVEARNVYGGTALGQALWCLVNSEPCADYSHIIETLLQAGAEIEPGTLMWLHDQEKLEPAIKRSIEQLLHRYGALS